MFQSEPWHFACSIYSVKEEVIMTFQNKVLILVLTAMAGFGTIGCGPQKLVNSGGSFSSTTMLDNKPVANCSQDVAGLNDLSFRMQTYASGTTENFHWIRTKFTSFPTAFDLQSAVVFWAYSVGIAGDSSTPLQAPFHLEVRNTDGSFTKVSNDMYEVTWSDLRNFAGQMGLPATSTAEVMSQMIFVVKLEGAGLTTSQVLMPTLYGEGSDPDRYITGLIPKFFANPADYASGKAAVLQNLHPLKNLPGLSAAQYLTEVSRICISQ
jgi:hypothetical protein